MIEALVEYIEDKGFHTRVQPRLLVIYKTVNDQIEECWWSISRQELNQAPKENLFHQADIYMTCIDLAITRRCTPYG